jgi:hypothetical protein
MSWAGALPFWYYDLNYEQFLAECSCCFENEWLSASSKVAPEHIIQLQQSFNEEKDQNNYPSLPKMRYNYY